MKKQRKQTYFDEAQAKQVIKKALTEGCLLRIRTPFWGNRITLSEEEMNNLPTDLVQATKKLIDESALSEIKSARLRARNWPENNNCLPWIDKGISFVPKAKIDGAIKFLEKTKLEQQVAVKQLCEQFETLKKQMKKTTSEYNKENGTNIIFDETKYPSTEDLKRRWRIEYQLFFLTVPENSKVLTDKQIKQEQQKLNDSIREAAELGVLAVRTAFTKMVVHLNNKLSTGESFKNTTVVKLQEFVDDFKQINVWDDKQLKVLIDKCKKYLKGVDAEGLREDEEFAKQVETNMSSIVDEIKKFGDERLERSLDF